MEHHDQSQADESRPGDGAAVETRRQNLRTITQSQPLNYSPHESNLPSAEEQNNNAATDGRQNQSSQASERYPVVGDAHRLREAQIAFAANSGVTATTPSRTAWNRAGLLSTPQNVQSQNEEHQDPEWTPRLALGSIDVKRLGAKEAARRHLLQWNRILEYNAIQNPGSLETVTKHRNEAARVYEELLASERDEDCLPKNELPSYRNERIQARTSLLWDTLLETPEEGCEPMKANITAALKGYNTGAIGFSEHYTLIYAGQIVDTTCTTYSEFTTDRQGRLDRYFDEYGPGYLWWEPPLAQGRERALAKKSTVLNLDREDEFSPMNPAKVYDDACYYKVPIGFRKDDSLGHRMGRQRRRSVVAKAARPDSITAKKRKWETNERTLQDSKKSKREKLPAGDQSETLERQATPKASTSPDPASQQLPATTESGDLEDNVPQEGTAHTYFFDMLLDSGAELPILLHSDFELLGYSKQDMNAASVIELHAAAGQASTALCFELQVGLELHGSPDESWEELSAYSEAHFFPSRVIKLPPTVDAPEHGAYSSERLSGMVPFLAYYMASAPGNGRLCLGEKRAEVLGIDTLPAGLKYDPANNALSANGVKRQQQIDRIHEHGGEAQGLREVRFETDMENGKKLIDEDTISEGGSDIRSIITIIDKCGKVVDTWNQGSGKSKSRHE